MAHMVKIVLTKNITSSCKSELPGDTIRPADLFGA